MVKGIWTKQEFRANSRSKSVFGKRKSALVKIDHSLDLLHGLSSNEVPVGLKIVDDSCRQWLAAHPHTSSTPMEGKKTSKRRQGIEQLMLQVDAKRKGLYGLDAEEQKRRGEITSQYETSDVDLGVAPGGKDPRNLKARSAFHQELLEKTIALRKVDPSYDEEELNPEQIGYLHAKAVLKMAHVGSDNRDRAKVEALRIVSKMLGKNPTLARAFTDNRFEIVVVPADTPFTSLPEFRNSPALVNQDTGDPVVISENTSGPSRTWAETRGMGGIRIGNKIYVAVTEENLLGTVTSGGAKDAGAVCYAATYSTTAHEFAHTIHLHAMTPSQNQIIIDCYKRKLKGVVVLSDGTVRSGNVAVDPGSMTGSIVGGAPLPALQVKQALEVEWVDGKRLHATGWANEGTIYVRDANGNGVFDGGTARNFMSRYGPTSNYASSSARENWAQLASAYLGCNGGTDPYTGRPRHNGRQWIMANEEQAMCNLLDEVFSAGAHSGFGAAELPATNIDDDGSDEVSVYDYIKSRIALEKHKKKIANDPLHGLLRDAMKARRQQWED